MNLLLNGINADIENGSFERIGIYKNILNLLREIFEDESFEEVEDLLVELESNAEAWHTYQLTYKDVWDASGNEDLAKEIAWRLNYMNKSVDKK